MTSQFDEFLTRLIDAVTDMADLNKVPVSERKQLRLDRQNAEANLRAHVARAFDDARLFQRFKNLAGDVRGATDVTVKLYQDDATLTWFVDVGKRSYFGDVPSLRGAIEKACFSEEAREAAEQATA